MIKYLFRLQPREQKTKSKFIHQFNRFTNHIGFCYPIWFQLVGWTSTFIFGYLFINIIAKVDINPSWYQGLRLSFKLNADQNNAIFISLMFFNMFVVPVAYYYPAKFMVYLLNKIDHKIRTKRKNKLNK